MAGAVKNVEVLDVYLCKSTLLLKFMKMRYVILRVIRGWRLNNCVRISKEQQELHDMGVVLLHGSSYYN